MQEDEKTADHRLDRPRITRPSTRPLKGVMSCRQTYKCGTRIRSGRERGSDELVLDISSRICIQRRSRLSYAYGSSGLADAGCNLCYRNGLGPLSRGVRVGYSRPRSGCELLLLGSLKDSVLPTRRAWLCKLTCALAPRRLPQSGEMGYAG
jgi:hypothetical protein